jgi:predicted transcriptional regulator
MTSMKFKIPADLKAALLERARVEGEAEATIIRRALRAYLAELRDETEAAA